MSRVTPLRGARPTSSGALVGIALGGRSDAEAFEPGLALLDDLEVPWEMIVASAHRTPDRVAAWAKSAQERGLQVVIAVAGDAAHLAGILAAQTPLPVLCVPVPGRDGAGAGGPVAHRGPAAGFASGETGAADAALFAARVLALADEALASRLARHALEQQHAVLSSDDELQSTLAKRREERLARLRARTW